MVDTALLKNFLDAEGRLKSWPSKRSIQLIAFEYLAERFEFEAQLTELDVNSVLALAHTYKDNAMLRRGLIETGHLKRTPDGRTYWRPKKEESHE